MASTEIVTKKANKIMTAKVSYKQQNLNRYFHVKILVNIKECFNNHHPPIKGYVMVASLVAYISK